MSKKIEVFDEGEVENGLHRYRFEPPLPERYGTRAFLIFGWRMGSTLLMKGKKLAGLIGHPDDLQDFLGSKVGKSQNGVFCDK